MKRVFLAFLLVISISAVPIHSATADIIQLRVAADHLTGYNRSLFKLWIDVDKNGCDTRKEVLLEEAVVKPKKGKKCVLTGGKWISPYDGISYRKDSALDIDHLVPLAEAWRSGAWAWTPLQRQNYANDLTEPKALVAVSLGLNRQKGDKDPSAWLPPKDQCGYISNWITVKYKYGLTIDAVERVTLSASITKCAITNVVIGEVTPIASVTPTPSATPTTVATPVPTTTPIQTPTPSATQSSTTTQTGITAGAFCAPAGAIGTSKTGTTYTCKTSSTDTRNRWRQ
jgi:hypothetical protein